MKAEIVPCGAYYLYKDSKSPYYQVRAEDSPRVPLFKSTKEKNLVNAKKVAKQIYSDWAAVKDRKAGEAILFKDLWHEYMQDIASFNKSVTTERKASTAKNHLLPAFGNRFLHEIQGLWPAFVRKEKAKRKDSTLFNERKYLMSAFQYAYDHGLIDKIPPIKTVPGTKKPIHIFTDKEIAKLLNGCGDDLELRLNILLGYCMGMRHGEIAKLELSDINLKSNTLSVRETKTKTDREISINEHVLADLKTQMAEAKKSNSRFLFPQVHNPGAHKDQRVFDKAWQDLKFRTGIKGKFHGLRHACANRLKQSDVPPAVAAAYLGMSLRVFDVTYGALGVDDTKTASVVIALPKAVESAVENALGARDV